MKTIATLTALALATTLAGCTGAANGNRGLESVHQPVVRNTIYQFDVAAGSGDIAPSACVGTTISRSLPRSVSNRRTRSSP